MSLFVRKPRNAGLRAHNGEIVGTGTWPALVDESTWRATQSVLNAPGRASGRKSVRRHLLTGVLQCGRCGGHLSGQWTTQKTIAYGCKSCRGVSIRAEHVEPLLHDIVAGRLAKNGRNRLSAQRDSRRSRSRSSCASAETLYGELDKLAVERAEGLLTARQVKISTDIITEKLAKIERRQQDQERLRVFDGIPLGKPEVADAIASLSPDRFRAVLSVYDRDHCRSWQGGQGVPSRAGADCVALKHVPV